MNTEEQVQFLMDAMTQVRCNLEKAVRNGNGPLVKPTIDYISLTLKKIDHVRGQDATV